jgi:hypothetical protein
MTSITLILAFLIGGVVGWRLDWLTRQLGALKDRIQQEPEPLPEKPTVAMGMYDRLDTENNVNTSAEFGIVQAKTPQLLDWEEQERVKKMNEPR